MPSTSWFRENMHRAFPFRKNNAEPTVIASRSYRTPPYPWFVDAGFVMGLDSGFVEGEHSIWLRRVYRQGDVAYFEFMSDAPGLYLQPLTFIRDLSHLSLFVAEHLDIDEVLPMSVSVEEIVQPENMCAAPLWSGYLVTGDLTDAADVLALGELLYDDNAATIEPALIQNLSAGFYWFAHDQHVTTPGAYVQSLSIGNDDRTRYSAPVGAPNLVWGFSTGSLIVNARCLDGNVRLKPGYNCQIVQQDDANTLTIKAVVGAGEGEPCAEIRLFAEEHPPTAYNTPPFKPGALSGSRFCNETVRTISGLAGPLVNFIAGKGVSITSLPESHRIKVDVNMLGMATCYISENV